MFLFTKSSEIFFFLFMVCSYLQLEKAKKKEAAFIVTFAKREQEIAELKVISFAHLFLVNSVSMCYIMFLSHVI